MTAPALTLNATSALWNGNTDFKPVMQCTEVKALQPSSGGANAQERYRISLSDGDLFTHAMLATQLVDRVKDGRIQPGSVLRLTEFLCNVVHGRKIVIVLNCDALGSRAIQGAPQNIQSKGPAGAPPQAAQAPAGAGQHQQPYQQPYQQQQPPPQHQQPYSAGGYGANMQQQQQRLSGGKENIQQQGGNNYYNETKPSMQQQQQQPNYQNPHQPPPPSYQQQQYQQPPQQPNPYNNGHHQQGRQAPYQQQQQQRGSYGGNPGGVGGYQQQGGAPQYGHGGNQHQQQHQQPNYVQRGPISRNEAPVRIVPIKSLNPYLNRWTIQARATNKSDIRRWQNAKGEGTVFNFDVCDVEGGEIRICAFKEACEKFFPVIEVGKVYMISKGSLRPARKQYNPLNSDFEIYLETSSTIEPCVEDERTSSIPSINFNFKPVMALETMNTGSIVDVVGVVLTVDGIATIQRRDGTETQKRSLSVKDDSNGVIELTCWGNFATNVGQELEDACAKGEHPVVAVKSARLGEYNGKTLGTISSTQLLVNPDLPEAGRLRHWFDQAGGAQSQATALGQGSMGGRRDRRVQMEQIMEEGLGQGGKPDYVECRGAVEFIKDNPLFYPACSLQRNGRTCQKKLQMLGVEDGDGGEAKGWCETCQAQSIPMYRYILQLKFTDASCGRWITCFGDQGEVVMGMPAGELQRVPEGDERMHFLDRAKFAEYVVKLKVAEETYNEESRIKCSISRLTPVNYAQEASELLAGIQLLLDGGDNRNVRPRY